MWFKKVFKAFKLNEAMLLQKAIMEKGISSINLVIII